MNKRIMQILCFIMLLCMAGCGFPSTDALEEDELMTVKATVTKTYGKSMEIRTEQGWVMSMPAIFATVEFILSDGTPLKDFSQKDIGEIYEKDLTGNDIVMSADGVKYVRNQLLVSAKMDCTKEKMESLGSAYGFEIVGYIELTQDYQIEFARDMEEAELLKMIKILEEEDCVSMCTLNYVMELSYD